MTKGFWPGALIVAGTLQVAADLFAAERGTPAEAKAMLAKAAVHYRRVGRKQALADFNAKKGPFRDRDLYIVCLGPDQTVVANGRFPILVGQSAQRMKDADGTPLGKAIWDASSHGAGSVWHNGINPVTRAKEPRVTFVQTMGDDVCAVGASNP